MDTQFVWREEFNIGVEVIDKEHQRLFKVINKLFTLNKEDANGRFACQEGVKYFKGHAMKHFADEEAYMESIGYEGLEQHSHIHRSFRENTLPALERELEETGYGGSFSGGVQRVADRAYAVRRPVHYGKECKKVGRPFAG